MISYRLLHAFNAVYGLVVLGLYIVAFLATFALFLYPPLAIIMVFLDLYLLVPCWAVAKGTKAWERSIARRCVHRGICPRCTEQLEVTEEKGHEVRGCVECGLAFAADGRPWAEVSEELEAVAAPPPQATVA